jgi:signal transduction histidine kinase
MAGQVFDEFFTSKEGGNGLGLHLSRQIVTAMGGTIVFDSAPGKTVFTVRLPFAG